MTDQRKEPETVEMEKVPGWAIALKESVDGGFRTLNANIEIVSNDLGVVKERVGILETWRNESDTRLARASSGTRNLSTNDAKQDAVIAGVVVTQAKHSEKLEELATTLEKNTAATMALKTALLDDVKGFFRNHPQVGQAAIGLAMAAMGWAAAWFSGRGH